MRFPCLLQVSPPFPLCIMWVRGAGIWQGIKESRNLLLKVDFHPSSSKTLLSIMYNLGLGCIEIHGGKSFYLHPTLVWRASVWERNRYPANFSLMRVQIGERKAGEGRLRVRLLFPSASQVVPSPCWLRISYPDKMMSIRENTPSSCMKQNF